MLQHRGTLSKEDGDRTPTHSTHLCSTVCSPARLASHALGSSHTDCSVIFVRLKRILHLVLHMSHPWLPFTTSTSSSSFTLHSTTQEHAAQSVQQDKSENTQYITHISKLLQSTSCTIKNHSGLKTCRVAETRARQLPQVMSPKSLRLSQGSKIILEIHINCTMCRKLGEEDYRAPITKEVEEFGEN